jgi:hypothetical protein
MAMGVEEIFAQEVAKKGETHDLKDDSRHHKVGANILQVRAELSRCNNTAASARKNEDNRSQSDLDVPA